MHGWIARYLVLRVDVGPRPEQRLDARELDVLGPVLQDQQVEGGVTILQATSTLPSWRPKSIPVYAHASLMYTWIDLD